MLTNPAEDFQFHLMQVGVYDQERIIHVPYWTIHHTKSKSVMKSFLSYHFFQVGKSNYDPVLAINLLQDSQAGSISWISTHSPSNST